jgi:hypothetical protein
MKIINTITILLLGSGAIFSSCRKADPIVLKQQKALSDIYATIDGRGGERLFDAVYSVNNDTIYFNIPYYYPVDSDKESDLTRIILRATIPAEATVSPALGELVDLTKPLTITVTAGNGEPVKYTIVSKKVGDLSLTSAKIKYTEGGRPQVLDGVIQANNDVLFYVLPGTNVSGAVFSYVINKHSTGSLANDVVIDLSQNRPFTVTGVDGSKRVYALKAVEPVKLAYGIGINRKLWSKTAAELSFTGNNETSIAVSGDHIVLVRRTSPSKFSVYNRFTGAYVQEMFFPYGAQLSFQMVEDSSGNLISSSWAPKNAKFILYKYQNALDVNPVKIIDWTNNNPTAISGDGGVGRRVNIFGDVNKNATIMAAAGQSKVIYKWQIKNGILVNNTPAVITYNTLATGASNLGYYAEAQPVSADDNANYFLNYQFEVALVNGTTHERIAALSLGWPVVFTMPTAYAKFNNATYLGIVKFLDTYDLNKVKMSLYDVTRPSDMSMSPSNAAYSSFNVFNSDYYTGTINGNGTADICIGYSNNKERMQVYTLLTNGGIWAHEFTNYKP